ncbi:MAG: dCTP deaminase [bacterium]
MILADLELLELVKLGYLPTDVQIGPCSVDLRLGRGFRSMVESRLQYLDRGVIYEFHDVERHILRPKEFVLATTMERIQVPEDMAAFVHGRSSIGRLGLQVQNAGFVDSGFEGEITLELYNQSPNPIMLESGWRVCQISFHRMEQKARYPYNGKYQHQKGATGSKLKDDLKQERI